MKKTKIVGTIGPTSFDKNIIHEMLDNGMDVVRLNLSHASFSFCDKVIKMIRELEEELNRPIGIMLDLDGPSVRLDKFIEGSVNLEEGKEIKIYNYPVICNNTQFSVNYENISHELVSGDTLLLSDGKVILEVVESLNDYALLKVIAGGEIKSNQTVYVRNKELKLPFISDKDHENIMYAIKKNVDFLALSYVRDEQDVLEVTDLLIENENNHINLIAKIENNSALNNLDEIIKVSDGVMVARGDLAIEVSFEKLPYFQKTILSKAKEYEKVGIVATDFLMSMEENPRPSRSEISDIYNAVMDGCDAILLSGETTIGKYPALAVDTLTKVILSAEEDYDYDDNLMDIFENKLDDITSNIAYSVLLSATKLNAKCIIANTYSGYTASKISQTRCKTPILGLSPFYETVRLLTINYGVYPKKTVECKSADTILKMCTKEAIKTFDLVDDDIVIITGGLPISNKNTNFMEIEVIEKEA